VYRPSSLLELEFEAPVSPTPKLLLRRGGDVAAEPFELRTVTPVDALLGMHVDSRDLGDELVVIHLTVGAGGIGVDQTQRGLADRSPATEIP
jgi:hypothetical protein